MFVKEVFVDGGPSMKRVLPAPMGRAYRMLKRSNHLTIVIAQKKKKQAPAPPAKSKDREKVKETKQEHKQKEK
jgi:hypothetical protein